MNDKQPLIKALELDKAGDWAGAHKIVQDLESVDSYRVHAYLHRKEGNPGNANYWYNRANKKMPDYDLDQEWNELLKGVLNNA